MPRFEHIAKAKNKAVDCTICDLSPPKLSKFSRRGWGVPLTLDPSPRTAITRAPGQKTDQWRTLHIIRIEYWTVGYKCTSKCVEKSRSFVIDLAAYRLEAIDQSANATSSRPHGPTVCALRRNKLRFLRFHFYVTQLL
ncbi:hypothetical protein HOLleu_09327 [Holothuria leucospilota]|uniref:Uncharacterized protein n=1 Tax=Holothuria leucospilota TaxID=206669 RepID=A0A9Q1CJY8_HOLLE|nr:hypothetical protein HOLleu_09327 [Holothuria leucospilota]